MKHSAIYYKGNPITSQNYLPESCLRDRWEKRYLVQIPQGKSYFQGHSRKRQFSNLHNQSEIRDRNIFQQSNNPHFIHSNLEVSDIQGATPNTILPQALKNRMKKNRFKLFHELKHKKNYQYSNIHHNSATEELDNYLAAYNKQKQASVAQKQINYHFRAHRIETEPIMQSGTHLHQNQDINQNHYNYEFARKEELSPKYSRQYKSARKQNGYIRNRMEMMDSPYANISNPETLTPQFHQKLQKNKNIDYLKREQPKNSQSLQHKIGVPQRQGSHKRSDAEIKSLRHGDNRKIQFYDPSYIRKLNPTYNSQNYMMCM